ncbi:hypothetical protein JCM10212_004718 [Sporobolomyces blumeae]
MRPSAAPPTPQEIERKLGSPTAVPAQPSIPLESVELQRRASNQSRKNLTGHSGDEEQDSYPSPPRPSAHLAAISETDDALASGSESDASSDGERRPPRQAFAETAPSRRSRDSGGLSENVALKSGYLSKKGERRKAWKKRWFVLRGGQLAMYKNEKEYRLLRLIPINDIHMAAPIEMKKHSNTFGIVTPRRTYYVEAGNAAEVQDWCQVIERARNDSKAGQTLTSLDTPTEEDHRTPLGHSPAQTPTGYASPPTSSAIPIPNALATYPQQSFQPHSYATTASTSIPSPSFLASSSYTSSSSGLPHPAHANPLSSSPQSNSAFPLSSSPGDSDLQQLSAGVDRLRLPSQEQPARSLSSGSESLAPPIGLGQHAATTGGYDSTSSYDISRGRQPSPSPGVVSSSEDEDGFEAYAGPEWSTPGAVDRSQQRAQQQSGSYFQQAVQQLPPPPPLAAPPMLSPPIASGATGLSRSQSQGQTGFADPNKVILAGYLMKQGKRKTWRKRWFVLMSGMLMYSRSHMDTKMHRQIPLSAILDAIEYEPAPAPTSKRTLPLSSGPLSPSSDDHSRALGGGGGGDGRRNYEHCFKIITPKRTYLVCAPSEEDEIKWLAALQCLVARKSSQGMPTAGLASQPATPGGVLSPPVPGSTQPALGVPPTQQGAGRTIPQRQKSQDESGPPPTSASNSLRPGHTRGRSMTETAKNAVRDVERRFHFQQHGGDGSAGVQA